MFKAALVTFCLGFASQAFAICDSGYTALSGTVAITEGVVSKVYSIPATFGAPVNTCFPNITVYFSSLTETGVATTCKKADMSSILNIYMVNSLADCISVSSSTLKLLMTAQFLSKKLTATHYTSGLQYNGSAGFTIE